MVLSDNCPMMLVLKLAYQNRFYSQAGIMNKIRKSQGRAKKN